MSKASVSEPYFLTQTPCMIAMSVMAMNCWLLFQFFVPSCHRRLGFTAAPPGRRCSSSACLKSKLYLLYVSGRGTVSITSRESWRTLVTPMVGARE